MTFATKEDGLIHHAASKANVNELGHKILVPHSAYLNLSINVVHVVFDMQETHLLLLNQSQSL